MALALYDRVQQTGTANTTVSFTLSGTVTGFQSFSVIGNANTTYYAATDSSGNWEVGLGTYLTIGPTLTRTTIYSSSNAGSAVTFSGTVNVFVTYPAGYSVVSSNNAGTSGYVLTSGGTGVAPTWSAVSVAAATPTALGTVYGLMGTNSNTAIGYALASGSLSGSNNSALGSGALAANTTGSQNTAVGMNAAWQINTGSYNTAIGYGAIATGNCSNNTAIGAAAMLGSVTGSDNTVVGKSAGTNITSGTQNSFLGSGAGSTLTTGANNIILGYNAAPSAITVSNENTFGNSSSTSNRFWGDFKMGGWCLISSIRF